MILLQEDLGEIEKLKKFRKISLDKNRFKTNFKLNNFCTVFLFSLRKILGAQRPLKTEIAVS